jgi:predicted transposase YdaD
MPIVYDLTKDIRFKEGVEVGIEKGIEKGIERGIKKGEEMGEIKKARLTAIQLLKNGLLSVVTIAEAIDVPLSFVLQIQEELEKKSNMK